ncbi:MAG: hypothetical protein GEV03_05640 [Streptosporangiales bacterium]|nr:hypothetical protein [Streptosporangiales bacterium]
MRISDDLAHLLEGRPDVDSREQAFPFLTVDEGGFPHVALLSRSEVDVTSSRSEILVAVASVRTSANLRRSGKACLIVIDGATAHYVKLRMLRTVEMDGMLGAASEPVEHKRDSAGIPMEPISFPTSAELAELERWDTSARVLLKLGLSSRRDPF